MTEGNPKKKPPKEHHVNLECQGRNNSQWRHSHNPHKTLRISFHQSTLRYKSSPIRVGVNLGVQIGGLFRPTFRGGVFITTFTQFSVSDPLLPPSSIRSLTCHLLTVGALAAVELSLRPRCSIWSAALSPFRFASSDEGLSSLFDESEDEDAELKKLRSSKTNWSFLRGRPGLGFCAGESVVIDALTNFAARGRGCFSACFEMAAGRGGEG